MLVNDLDDKHPVFPCRANSAFLSTGFSFSCLDAAHSTVTGIDLARDTIERAQTRTADKRERLTFKVGDMDDLAFPRNSFDTIISIDTFGKPFQD